MKTQDLLDKLDSLALRNLEFESDPEHDDDDTVNPQTPKHQKASYNNDDEDEDLDLDYYTDNLCPDEYDHTLNNSSQSSSNSYLSRLLLPGQTSPIYNRPAPVPSPYRNNIICSHSTNEPVKSNTSISTITGSLSAFSLNSTTTKVVPTPPKPSISNNSSTHHQRPLRQKEYQQVLNMLEHGLNNNKLVLDCMEDMIRQENHQILQELDQLINDINDSVPNNTYVFRNLMKQ